mgnify:FL=1
MQIEQPIVTAELVGAIEGGEEAYLDVRKQTWIVNVEDVHHVCWKLCCVAGGLAQRCHEDCLFE